MSYRPTRPYLDTEKSNRWRFIDFPAETTVDELLKPDTWAHCSKGYLRQYDEILVVPHGGAFRAHLIVMDAGPNYAKLRLLNVTLLNASDAPSLSEEAPVEVRWNGPADKYAVFRKGDKEKLKAGFAIKAEAEEWANKHTLAMA